MIVFDLICMNGHSFEGWFDDSGMLDDHLERNQVSCPVCGDTQISKQMSPVTYSRKGATSHHASGQEDFLKKVSEVNEKISAFIGNNFEDVGADFTKEALKIHYGVSEPRNIKGVNSDEDEKILKKEGVNFLKIPILEKKKKET